MVRGWVFLAIFLSLVSHACSLSVPNFYGNNMVFQRNKPTLIWGAGDKPSETIYLNITTTNTSVNPAYRSASFQNITGADSLFYFTLPTASLYAHLQFFPFNITITGTSNTIQITNVLFGEVWLCSGQSNMELAVGQTYDNVTFSTEARSPILRLYRTNAPWPPNQPATTPQNNTLLGPSYWSVANQDQTFWGFSAVCYSFGREMTREMPGIPVGLIESSVGGTNIEAWLSTEGYLTCNYTYTIFNGTNMRNGLYNSMISPFRTLSLAGFLWYQGENNVPQFLPYQCYERSLVEDWRATFNDPTLFFGLVQLTALPGNEGVNAFYPIMRYSQAKGIQGIPNTFYTTGIDLGDPFSPFGSIHSRNKTLVGQRLFKQVANLVYGVQNQPTVGPVVTSCCTAIKEPVQIFQVTFDEPILPIQTPFCGQEQVLYGKCCESGPFDVIASSGRFNFAPWTDVGFGFMNTTYSNNTAFLTFNMTLLQNLTNGPGYQITQVRYAYDNYPQCVLYNPQLLPSFSFNITCNTTCGANVAHPPTNTNNNHLISIVD